MINIKNQNLKGNCLIDKNIMVKYENKEDEIVEILLLLQDKTLKIMYDKAFGYIISMTYDDNQEV